MFFRYLLLTCAMISVAKAMDLNDVQEGYSYLKSSQEYDRGVSSLTASSSSDEELNLEGFNFKSFITRIGLPVDEEFLDILQPLKGEELKAFVESNADEGFNGAVTYLFLTTSDWIHYNHNYISKALNCLESSPLSYGEAYYYYFRQKLAFRNIFTFHEDIFTREAFSLSKDLIDYFEYRSLAMQIWGALTAIKENFEGEGYKSGQYFLRNPYQFEAILLGFAFSRYSFGFMPEIYKAKLAIIFESVLETLKGRVFILPKAKANFDQGNVDIFHFDTYFPELSKAIEPWVSQGEYTFSQEGIEALTKSPKKSILKKENGRKNKSGSVSFASSTQGITDNIPGKKKDISLWEKIINGYQKEIPLQQILDENQRASSSWIHSFEDRDKIMRGSFDVLLSTQELKRANINTLLRNRRDNSHHQKLRAHFSSSESEPPQKKRRKE